MNRVASFITAKVTEFEFTKKTCHVITALSALYLCTAHWTEDNSINTIATQARELGFHCFFTTCPVAVPVLPTAEADVVRTLWTTQFLRTQLRGCHVAITVWLGAKSDKWVALEHTTFFEVVKFIEKVPIFTLEDLIQLRDRDFLSAFMLKADKLFECVVLDVLCEVFAAAFRTIAMTAIEHNRSRVCDRTTGNLNFIYVANRAQFRVFFRSDRLDLTVSQRYLRR